MATKKSELTSDEKRLIELYRGLPETARETLCETATALNRRAQATTVISKAQEEEFACLAERVVRGRSQQDAPNTTQVNLAELSFRSG